MAMLLLVCNAFAQNYKPIRGMGIRAYLAQNGQCVAASNPSNIYSVIDSDTDNGASLGTLLNNTSSNGISIINNNVTYPAGSVTGFNVDIANSAITSVIFPKIRNA